MFPLLVNVAMMLLAKQQQQKQDRQNAMMQANADRAKMFGGGDFSDTASAIRNKSGGIGDAQSIYGAFASQPSKPLQGADTAPQSAAGGYASNDNLRGADQGQLASAYQRAGGKGMFDTSAGDDANVVRDQRALQRYGMQNDQFSDPAFRRKYGL